jgi:hypothetical protein
MFSWWKNFTTWQTFLSKNENIEIVILMDFFVILLNKMIK